MFTFFCFFSSYVISRFIRIKFLEALPTTSESYFNNSSRNVTRQTSGGQEFYDFSVSVSVLYIFKFRFSPFCLYKTLIQRGRALKYTSKKKNRIPWMELIQTLLRSVSVSFVVFFFTFYTSVLYTEPLRIQYNYNIA